MKKIIRNYTVEGIIFASICIFCLLSFALVRSMSVVDSKINENYTYVSYEVLTDNVVPVTKEEQKNVVRPYNDDKVKVGKTFYDYQNKETQEKSIIYYENTYIQNSGVDYINGTVFKVNAIKDGKVLSVTKDDITGTTIKIKHNDNLISVYQSVKDVLVKEKEEIKQGQIIASSSTNAINQDLGNHLHFELYSNNKLIDPEKFFNENIKEY